MEPEVTYQSNIIILSPGFKVDKGSRLRVKATGYETLKCSGEFDVPFDIPDDYLDLKVFSDLSYPDYKIKSTVLKEDSIGMVEELPLAGDRYLYQSDEMEVDVITTVDEPLLEQDVNVYPNPFQNVVHVSSSELIKTIEVYNEKGQSVQALEKVNDYQSDVQFDACDEELYLIKVVTGHNVTMKKVIKF